MSTLCQPANASWSRLVTLKAGLCPLFSERKVLQIKGLPHKPMKSLCLGVRTCLGS